MTDSVLVFNAANTVVDTVESFYTSPSGGLGTRIKSFTAANNGETSISYKAYIYSSSGTVVAAIVPQTIVVIDRADYGPAIVNQVIPPGGTLRMESSTADDLNFYVTGVEQEST
jgi:hypothetical protein